MTKVIRPIILFAVPAFVCLVLLLWQRASSAACQDKKRAVQHALPNGPAHIQTLFPALDSSAVTAVSVITPERRFDFRRSDSKRVSVNGSQADSDAFLTLLSQIAELPVDSSAAFSLSDANPLLTLVVTSGEAQHTARFYPDDETGENTRIISGTCENPQYRQTDGWRVGTLMMVCEGTLIQDELGNGIPVPY